MLIELYSKSESSATRPESIFKKSGTLTLIQSPTSLTPSRELYTIGQVGVDLREDIADDRAEYQ